jgi:2TM domain-containing protein
MSEDHIFIEAKRRVKRKKAFYRHLAVYSVINTVMFFIVLLNEHTFDWLVPMSFWGIGLAIHYFSVFGLPGTGLGGSDWEAKEINKEMSKLSGSYEDLPKEELELREIEKEKRGWDDSDLV